VNEKSRRAVLRTARRQKRNAPNPQLEGDVPLIVWIDFEVVCAWQEHDPTQPTLVKLAGQLWLFAAA
jgi:hypothetical protein